MSEDPHRVGPLGWAVRVCLLAVLGLVLVQSTADKIDGRLVNIGEDLWPGYAMSLREDPEPPLCQLEAARLQVETCKEPAPDAPAGGDDPFGGTAGEDPFGGAAGDDPFGGTAGEDPFGGAAGNDPFGGTAGEDPFGGEPAAAAAVPCPAARSLLERCEQDWASHQQERDRLSPTVRVFRAVERAFLALSQFAYGKHLLSIVLLLGGLQATSVRAHIALRDVHARREHVVNQAAQLLSHVLLCLSSFADWRVGRGLEVEVDNPGLSLIWTVGFALLAVVNVRHLVRPPPHLQAGGSPGRALLTIPLYAWMVLLSGVWFLLVEQHPSGQAIYLHKFAQFPSIYLAVALYIWAGMLLERSKLPRLLFDVLRPWGLPPLILAFSVVTLSALPTAYSGASGIFVIAAGAVIYEELRRAGATRQQALMTTAMSGSLGVVLRPCLVVVLVAALNKEVTTDQLFSKGFLVFLLTAGVFLLAALILHKGPFTLAPVSQAAPEVGRAFGRLLPYGLVGLGVVVVYGLGLDTPLNERSAPWMLPIGMLAVLLMERWRLPRRRQVMMDDAARATGHTAEHIGALLFLMAATVCLGGLVERAEVMEMLPQSFGGRFTTMGVLVVIMVLVGMTMDAMGAVILVSVTVADIAYRNGIDPVHFWMMVLVAFELGYLTPPVALNHLLAKQVVGAEAELTEEDVVGGFYSRHEHTIVPMVVMGVALLLVAFVPLLWT